MSAREHMRLIFEGTGSRGDVAPLLELAGVLAQRGYCCRLLANSGYEQEARERGVELTATVERQTAFRKGEAVSFSDYLYPGLPAVQRCLADVGASSTVCINTTRLSASNLICEQRGIDTVRLHLSPFVLRSLVSPPWPYRARAEGPPGREGLRRLYHAIDTDQRVLGFLNQQRREHGLCAVQSAWHAEPHLRRQLAMFPSWFCEPAADWPVDLELVGFPLPAARGALPPAVLDFVARHGRPIVFTTGTFVDDTDSFVALARACCEQLGRPGIFLSKHRAQLSCAGPSGLLEIPFAELGLLLPRAALIVHHAGVGTSARALQAGIPQIACPTGFDQFDNAQRLRQLGVACIADRRLLSAADLCAAIESLLGSKLVAERSLALAAQSRDGLERAADVIEAVVQSRRVASPGRSSAAGSGAGIVSAEL
ncbi:MAG TPA: nucleotide disphospho-sugar-binding domain-containing protein [Polyangiaceae bacterium]|jgi:rhamnosyltransferase subunit B|nr:nucleotide disphospho-sugar-binding domain-containing protein [Polyangiaceae bacterium]